MTQNTQKRFSFHEQAGELAKVVLDHLRKNHSEGMIWTQVHDQLAEHSNSAVKRKYSDFQEAVRETNETRFKETDARTTMKNGLAYLLALTKTFEIDKHGQIIRKT